MFQASSFNKKKNGFIFIEILVAIGLISVVFITLLGIVFLVLNISTSLQKVAQADFLAREELEAVRSFRDGTLWLSNGLGSLSFYGSEYPYYFTLDNAFNPPRWKINQGQETIGIFTRRVNFFRIYRDSENNNLYVHPICDVLDVGFKKTWDYFFGNEVMAVVGICTEDDNTRGIVVTITYEDKTYQVVTYLTNWQGQ